MNKLECCKKKGHYEICEVHHGVKNPRSKCPQCLGIEERRQKMERKARAEGQIQPVAEEKTPNRGARKKSKKATVKVKDKKLVDILR